jgi:CRP-like cAMP-binding protein
MYTSIDTEELCYRLKKDFRFFNTLNKDEIHNFVSFCKYRKECSGVNLWSEGDTDNYAAFIITGKLGIKKKTEFDKYMIVGTFAKGSVAGELCLLTDRKRSVTAVIMEDVELVILESNDFEKLITEYPLLGLKLLRHIFKVTSKRLARSTDRIASIF